MLNKRSFGFSAFIFDAEAGQLSRNGKRLRIPEQTSRLLTTLLEQVGNVVTREELRSLLWPEGEFLDYDRSINKVVSNLRYILHDDPKSPKFVETIPKRGYRFLGDVKLLPTDNPKSASSARGLVLAIAPPPEPFEVQTSGSVAGDAVIHLPETTSQITMDPSVPAPSDRLWLQRIQRHRGMIAAGLMGILCLTVAGGIVYKLRASPSRSISMGIAPFEASGPDAEPLAESFRLDLTDAVSQLPSVQVRAAHSFRNAQPSDANIKALAQSLQLDALLFGKFTLNGNNCAIQFELVRGSDATHLASFQYGGTTASLASIRDKAQRDIFSRLELSNSGKMQDKQNLPPPSAYEAYLRGRYHLSQWTDDSLRQALKEFETALSEDRSFSKAHAGMASAYVVLAEHGAAPRTENYNKAEEQANIALKLDPSLAEAHAMLGMVELNRDWNMQAAEKELHEAVERDPSQALYHLWYSILLCDRGRFNESLEQIDLAHASDPFWPPVYMTEVFLAGSARQNARALAASQKLVELMPSWPLAHSQRAWSLWYTGQHEEAISEWRQVAIMEKDTARVELEEKGLEAFRRGGVAAYARVRVNAIDSGKHWSHTETDFVPSEWYAYAGDREKALSAIQDLVDGHDTDALQLAVIPAYESLYRDQRFLALLSRVGLTLPDSYLKAAPQTAAR